jgi:hypothetical protein
MESLGQGESPSLNVRVTPVRKAQVKKLAEMQDCWPSEIVRAALDAYVKLQMNGDPAVRSQLLGIARTTAE